LTAEGRQDITRLRKYSGRRRVHVEGSCWPSDGWGQPWEADEADPVWIDSDIALDRQPESTAVTPPVRSLRR
jgi:hypothetical protein